MKNPAQNRSRVPEGVPAGGEFAVERKGETGLSTLGQDWPAPPRIRALFGGEDAGCEWAVARGPRETFNGYVRLHEGHPWAGRDVFDLAHSSGAMTSITYARDGWVGFDGAATEDEAEREARRLAFLVREEYTHPASVPDCLTSDLGPIVPGAVREGRASTSDPRVQAGEFFDTVVHGSQALHRGEPGTPYFTRVQADRPLSDAEVEHMSQLFGYEYARSVRGESLGRPERDTPCSFILATDTTKSASDDVGIALKEFEQNLPVIFRDGSPLRKTNRAGAGTKGTRLIEPLPDPPRFFLYYDDVVDGRRTHA